MAIANPFLEERVMLGFKFVEYTFYVTEGYCRLPYFC